MTCSTKSVALQTMVLCNNLEGPVDIALWEYAEQQMNERTRRSYLNSRSAWRRSCSRAKRSI